MKRIAAVILFVLMGTSASALAAATPEEAQRLTGVFQAYLGSETGVVTVTPMGESYATRFDLAPLFAKIKEPGVAVSLSPIEWRLTNQGGGKWQVDQDQPLSFGFRMDGKMEMKGSIGGIKGTGIFDESLGAFASTATDFTQFAYDQTTTESGVTSKVSYSIAAMHNESALSGTGTNADGTAKWTYSDLRETITMPMAPGAPQVDVLIASPNGSYDSIIKGLTPRPIGELIAWAVARPAKETIIAEQAVLKDKLRAALPLFGNVSTIAAMNEVSINTMIGKFAIAKLDMLIDVNGIVENGALREKFTLSGLQMPEGIVPPWAANLVPANLTVDFNLSDFNLKAPAALILDKLDLAKEPPLPKDIEPQLLQALLPSGAVKIGLGSSELIAKIFDLKAEGSMTAGPAANPAGAATVKLKGLDEIMAAIQAAPPEMGMQQAAPMIVVAKGMAKQEPDGYLSWKIESTPTGGVTVNGVDPMKMGGQQ